MTLNAQDKLLQRSCPTVMVPRFEYLDLLASSGHRFLAASDGLWLEVRRPWLHLIWPVALQNHVAMPYGKLEPMARFAFNCIPRELFSQFVADAKEHLPNEYAAWLIWNEKTRSFRYQSLQSVSAGPAHLKLDRPALEEGEHLVVDVHSHAHLSAFFSSADNLDDAGEVKLSVVIGSLGDNQKITSKLRLVAHGTVISAKDLNAINKLGVC